MATASQNQLEIIGPAARSSFTTSIQTGALPTSGGTLKMTL